MLLGKIKFALQIKNFFMLYETIKFIAAFARVRKKKISWVRGEKTETDLVEVKTQIMGEWAIVLWPCLLKFVKYLTVKKVVENFFKSSATASYSAKQHNETCQADTRAKINCAPQADITRHKVYRNNNAYTVYCLYITQKYMFKN